MQWGFSLFIQPQNYYQASGINHEEALEVQKKKLKIRTKK
jgi:hypothetical protein